MSLLILISLGCTPSSGTAGSYGSSIPISLGTLHTVLHSGCTSLHSLQVYFTLSPAFIVYRLFDDGHSDQYEMILIVVLICTSLIMSDVEHLFVCLLTICMSSLDKCLFRSFVHSLIRLFIFLVLSFMSCLYILEIISLSVFDLLLFSPILRAVFSPCL